MKLVIEHLGTVIKEDFLEKGKEYFIGRQSDCDFVLEDDSGISRKHVKIYHSKESGNWLVESISEWGGLYLDREEIQSIELESSCSLILKNYTFKFIQTDVENNLKTSNLNEKSVITNKTKIANTEHLLYSLRIFIEGEFSNYVNLNLGKNWILGRSEECDICIDYSFLTRRHVQILKRESKFYVKDLESANKTLLNGETLSPKKETLLKPNDEISVAELKVVFEVRNSQYEDLIKNLPVVAPDSELVNEDKPLMGFPKVILEESPEEKTVSSANPALRFITKRKSRLALLALLPVLLFALYFKFEENKKKKEALAKEKNNTIAEEKAKLEILYKEAYNSYERKKYQFCIEQLEELHRKSSKGYFKDSQQKLVQCQNGLFYQKQEKARQEMEKLRKETELKIQKLEDLCQKDFEDNKITNKMELHLCAKELLSLDPANPVIANIANLIQERETLKQLEEQKREEYRKFLQSKRILYYKAKKLADQNKILKAVAAYNVFLKSARRIAGLKSLYEQAEQERDNIQNKYNSDLNALYKECENLIENGKMKMAYSNCKKILKFKNYDQKAVDYIDQAKRTLQSKIKPLYKQSIWHENFSRVDEAMKIWNQILETDVKEGYYYKKADFQIKKYK